MVRRRGGLQFSQSVRIIIFILLFVVLFILYQTVFQAMQQNVALRRERVLTCQNAFELLQEKTDEQFAGLLQTASVVHEEQYLRRVALHEYSITDVLDAQQELKKLIASNLLLNQVHYYAREQRKLYNNTGVYDYPRSASYSELFEGVDEAELMQLLESVGGGHMVVLPPLRSERSVDNVIVAVLPIPYNSGAPYATLMLELSEEKLMRLVLPAELGQDIVYRFLREDGELLFANRDAELVSLGRQSEEGLALYEADGRTYYGFASQARGVAGMVYEMYVPREVIEVGMFTTAQMRLLSVGCLGLLLLLCPILYMWVYQPMRMLIEQLAGAQAAQNGRGLVRADYAIALREIEQMRQSNNSLLWKIDSNMNLVRASLLRHALEYGQKSEDFLALCQHADLNFQYPYFRLILVSAPKAAQRDVSEYMRLCQPDVDIYIVKTPDILYALVNAEHEGEISSAQVVDLVKQSGYAESDEQLHIARSAWTSDLLGLHQAYRSTREKLSSRIFHGKRSWEEEQESAMGGAARRYPANEILRLQEAAMARDMDKLREAVLDIQNFLLHESTRTEAAVLAASDVLHVLSKSCEADLSDMVEAVHKKGVTAADICRILGESLGAMDEASSRPEDTLTEEMMLYISEMLESPSLSIATVSEHFSLSESAFSHAFKKRTGGTFAKYVTDLKIQRAKSLLICTDLSVEAIADRLNYASASSFARMFKAETAFTPTQYRRLREKTE